MGIVRNDACHQEGSKEKIRNGNKINLFDRTELEAKIFWAQFAQIMRHLQSLADYVDDAHPPFGLRKVYIDLILNHLKIIKDLLFVSYGLELDTNPQSKECVTKFNHDNLIAFGFWALDNQKELECISEISSEWINHFLCEDKPSDTNLEEMLNGIIIPVDQKKPLAFLHNIDEQLQRTYIYAPYQGDKNESGVVSKQIEDIDETMRSIFSLLYYVAMTPVTLISNFDALVKEFRESENGEIMLGRWEHDLYLSKEGLLSRLREKENLKPWVDKCCLLHEKKMAKKELFVDITIPQPQHNPDMFKTSSWISIFTITAILQEYDKKHKLVFEFKPFFYNDEDEARKFIDKIRGLEPPMITSLVKKMVDKENYPQELKSKKFCELLIKHKLYTKSYQNWNGQV